LVNTLTLFYIKTLFTNLKFNVMKKTLLFIAGLMLAMSASAVDLYLRGNTPGWGAQSGDTYKFTQVSENVYELENIEVKGEFKIATIKGTDGWDDTYNYGPSNKTAASVNSEYDVVCGSGAQNFYSNDILQISKISIDVANLKVKIEGKSVANVCDITKDYGVKIRQYTPNTDTDLTFEGNGVYTAKGVEVAGAEFKLADADYNDINYGAGDDNSVVLGTEYSLVKGGGNLAFYQIQAGEKFDVTFTINEDWSASLLLVKSTETAIEDVMADDAVVAAYDLTGKPVAADAKGVVILQYASGKAAKVVNY
jgi:hypothetical protein